MISHDIFVCSVRNPLVLQATDKVIFQSHILISQSHTSITEGAFHSTKITGSNFRNFRCSDGTRPTASQNSRSRALQHSLGMLDENLFCLKIANLLNIFAALKQDDCETISCTILDNNDDVIILAAVACFMRREFTRVNMYFEVAIPAYLSGELENHFGMTRQTCQLLTQEIMHTGRIPTVTCRCWLKEANYCIDAVEKD